MLKVLLVFLVYISSTCANFCPDQCHQDWLTCKSVNVAKECEALYIHCCEQSHPTLLQESSTDYYYFNAIDTWTLSGSSCHIETIDLVPDSASFFSLDISESGEYEITSQVLDGTTDDDVEQAVFDHNGWGSLLWPVTSLDMTAPLLELTAQEPDILFGIYTPSEPNVTVSVSICKVGDIPNSGQITQNWNLDPSELVQNSGCALPLFFDTSSFSDGKFIRPGRQDWYLYSSHRLQVPFAGNYSIVSKYNYDGYVFVYRGELNVQNGTVQNELLESNDDYEGLHKSRVVIELDPDEVYTVVQTSYNPAPIGGEGHSKICSVPVDEDYLWGDCELKSRKSYARKCKPKRGGERAHFEHLEVLGALANSFTEFCQDDTCVCDLISRATVRSGPCPKALAFYVTLLLNIAEGNIALSNCGRALIEGNHESGTLADLINYIEDITSDGADDDLCIDIALHINGILTAEAIEVCTDEHSSLVESFESVQPDGVMGPL